MNTVFGRMFDCAQGLAECALAASHAGCDGNGAWKMAMNELKASYGLQPVEWYLENEYKD